MGNCQCQAAADAAAVVIQHPGGKVERLHGAATAAEVMRGNPGHYVALVVLRVSAVGGKAADPAAGGGGGGGARITKVKLLKPKDTLLLGQVYRLVTSQEVAKAIQARREDKMRRGGAGAGEVVVEDDRRGPGRHAAGSQGQGRSTTEQDRKRAEKSSDRQQQHRSSGAGGGRGRHWQPSLQSISEAASSRDWSRREDDDSSAV